MANWVIQNSEAFFLPMYEYFQRKLLEREFAMADETPLQVLHEPGRRAQTQSYMWLFRSGEDGLPPIILYKLFFVKHFSLKKASEFPVFSKGFSLL